ncbi:hypothetical protein Leryth_005830 [Lithospermum erythrorhizon]|nr:hypothetical protein Leryth_005830 [Lithospermum erythrorhizon]
MTILFLGYLLFSVQLCMASSSAPESSHTDRSRWSPARKTRVFAAESNRAPSAIFEAKDDKNGTSNVYEDDKRVVRTDYEGTRSSYVMKKVKKEDDKVRVK